MVFRCSPLFSFPVRFTPFSRGFEATAFRLSPLEYPQGQTRLPAKLPARPWVPYLQSHKAEHSPHAGSVGEAYAQDLGFYRRRPRHVVKRIQP